MSVTTPPQTHLDRALLRMVGALSIGAFAALLDTTVVGVAVHSLARTFDADLADTQWVTTAYLLALAAVIPATGWAAQRFGAAQAWVASLTVFLVGSALCGLSWSLASLVAFRVVQGAGAGMLFPLMRIIVVDVAGRDRLGRMMALIAIPVQLAPVVGPVLGGAVLQELSWRWIFLINVPIMLVAIVLSLVMVPRQSGGQAPPLDVRGLLTLSGGISFLIYALTRTAMGGTTGAAIAAPFALGVALLVCHALAARGREHRVLEFSLFSDRAFAASSALSLLNNFGLFAAVFLVPLFFQQAGGAGALSAGLVLAPQGMGLLLAVLVVGRLVDTTQNARALVAVGLAVVAVGTVPFALVEPRGSAALLSAALFVRGVGMAFAVAPTMTSLYYSLGAARVPAATTANAVLQQVGAAAGTAVIAVVLQQFVERSGEVAGFRAAYWVTLGFVAVCFVPAAFLPSGPKVAQDAASG